MSSVIPPEKLDMIIQGLDVLQLTRLMQISAVTIALYDHVITLADEIQLIWVKRWSLGKILFLIIRYQNLPVVAIEIAALFNNQPSQKFCHAWIQWQFCSSMSVLLWTEVMMQIRIYAMYNASRKILYFMLPLFAVTIFTAGIFFAKSMLNHGFSVELTQTLSVCRISGVSLASFWIPVICFETVLFALALYKGVEHFRDSARIDKLLNKDKGGFVKGMIECMVSGTGGEASTGGESVAWRGQRVLDVLVRDSVIYYGVFFIICFFQLLISIFDKPLVEAPVGWLYVIPAVLSSRLLFNVRRFYDATTIQGVGISTFSLLVHNDKSHSGSHSASRTHGVHRRGLARPKSGSRTNGTTLVVNNEETGTGVQRMLTISDENRDYHVYDAVRVVDHTTASYGRGSEENQDVDRNHDFDGECPDEDSNVNQRWMSLGWLAAEATRNRVLPAPLLTLPTLGRL